MQIDAVFLWVDSSDIQWREKINPYLEKKIDWNDKKDSVRYNSINEIEIGIISVLKFATYIRNIHLVTDAQKPKNFDKLKIKAKKLNVNLILVDHKTIFKNHLEFLPVFNSISIETLLIEIPNLSEHFVYFNDDFSLINKTKEEDFFIEGKPVLRGSWVNYNRLKKKKSNHELAKEFTAKKIGFNTEHYYFDHTPHPMRKSTIENYSKNNSEFFFNNLKYKFRNDNQFLVQGLANHLEIKNNTCVLSNELRLEYVEKYSWFIILKKTIRINLKKRKTLFLCFQGLEGANKYIIKYIFKWLGKKLDTNFRDTIK